MVTNGYISRAALEPLCEHIDGVSINLKAITEETYCTLNGGHLKPVLETLKTLKESKVWFEVITLLVPTYTDNMETVKGVTNWILNNLGPDTPLHFSRFHPEHKLTQLPPTGIETLLSAQDYAMKAGLHYVYAGNAPGLGRENTLCPGCKKTVIEREGFSITQMNIDKKSHCVFCGRAIPGRFA
jgi:pyruvate formate lyase activating enzyme